MPRTAEVIYVGDAASLIRASQEASASTTAAADSIVKSNEKVSASAIAAGKVAQEEAAKFGASAAYQAKVAGEAAAKQAKDAGLSADAQVAAHRRAADAAEAAAVRHGAASSKIAGAGKATVLSLAAIGAASVDMAAKLEGSTAAVAAAGQTNEKTAKKITDAFLNTAGSAAWSAAKMGEAYADVAGELKTVEGHALGAADASRVMNAAMTLAEATGGELKQTTDTLGKVMFVYRIGAEGAAKASDILFAGSKAGGVSIEELASSVDRLHGRLGALAPSLAESAGFIDVLAQHGITGRLVMGALNGTFNTLLGGSKATTAAAKELGLEIFDQSGKFVGLKSVITQLQPKMAGLTQETQLQYAKALFGASANKQLLAIIAQGPQAFEAATQAVSKHGSASQAAARHSETFERTLQALRATGEDLGAMLGQVLVPDLDAAGKGLVDVTKFLKENQGAAEALATVVAVVLGGAIGAFTFEKLDGVRKGLGAMGSALASLIPQSAATATAVEGADVAMTDATVAASTEIDAALVGTGIGVAVVALGVAALELKSHWSEVMQGLEEAAQAAGNFVIHELNGIIAGVEKLEQVLTLGLGPSLGRIHELSGAGGGSGAGATELSGQHGNATNIEAKSQNSFRDSVTVNAAKKYGVDPHVLWGIYGNETAYGTNIATSSAGAMGGFQFIPGTAKQYGYPMTNSPNPEQFKQQAEAAAKYMSVLTKQNHGNVSAALEQYSGQTPGYATKAFEGGKTLPSIEELTKKEAKHKPGAKAKAHAGPSTSSVEKWAETMVGHFPESTGQNTGPELDKLQGEFHTHAAAWCAEFATTAAMMGGANKAVRTASVATIREWAEQGSHGYKKGVSHTPHVGSLMMFGDSHVGFVSGVNKGAGTVTTIEGNANDAHGGGVTRYTHKIGEGDYASPAYAKVTEGAVALTQMSKSYESAFKAANLKIASDTKAGQSELAKMLAAIHSGSLAQLNAVVGGKHDKWLAGLVDRLHGDHTSALDKLDTRLVAVHEHAVTAQTAAFKAEMAKMVTTVEELGKQAAATWGEKRKTAIEEAHNGALSGIEGGPEVAAVRAAKEADEKEQDSRTERENYKTLGDAGKKLKEAKGNENPQEIREAKEAVLRAEESITAFDRQQDEKRREATIENEKQAAKKTEMTALERLAGETIAYEKMLNSQLVALVHSLEKAQVSYEVFAEKRNSILAGTGPSGGVISRTYREGESIVHVGPEGSGRAAGGSVVAGVSYPVGESGREMFTPSVGGRITPASQAGAASGSALNIHGDLVVNNRQDADRFAHQLAHKLSFGGR